MSDVRVAEDRAGEGEPSHDRGPAESGRRAFSGQGGTDEH